MVTQLKKKVLLCEIILLPIALWMITEIDLCFHLSVLLNWGQSAYESVKVTHGHLGLATVHHDFHR